MRVIYVLHFLTFSLFVCVTSKAFELELPNVSGISRDLTGNLSVDQFFSLWIIFNDDDVQISDKPFTVLSPQNKPTISAEVILSHPDTVKETLLDHIVLGQKLRLDDVSGAFHFRTLGGKIVSVQEINGTLYANHAKVIIPRMDVSAGGVLVVLDDYLFPIEITQTESPRNTTRVANEEYTVLIPTDHAFQRWHPIDWGFYPFSVPEFTESVIINHFISENLRQDNIKDGQTVKTLGGREIVFTRNLFFLSANGAPIVRGDTPIHHGNLMFVSEVLFVDEAEVHKLHQKNKDKETPPLLAFPWFGAQFLSHAFLALERQRKFSHITRFLNLADLAPHVSGKGYSFFVPTDEAFEELGLGQAPDNYLSAGEGLDVLLNHFVKGRLYERDLKNGTEFLTMGNKTLHVSNGTDGIHINDAKIIESEIFVYNLGTMFYIDKVLFVNKTSLPMLKDETVCDDGTTTQATSLKTEAEQIPAELADVETFTDLLQEEESQSTEPGITIESDVSIKEEIPATSQMPKIQTMPLVDELNTEFRQHPNLNKMGQIPLSTVIKK
ncbi:hypothetical protein RUM43_008453 [Polyplax serrata]|uniref:FAS1 domain-containing protein n=1 Tax=Polyplax serrata TaxID=468196 RepID=A0AAN8NYK2_POLSC